VECCSGHEMLVECLFDGSLSLFRAAPFHFLSFSPLVSFYVLKKIVDSYNSWPQRALNYTALIGLENLSSVNIMLHGAETFGLSVEKISFRAVRRGSQRGVRSFWCSDFLKAFYAIGPFCLISKTPA
jgi:hypothetical protein